VLFQTRYCANRQNVALFCIVAEQASKLSQLDILIAEEYTLDRIRLKKTLNKRSKKATVCQRVEVTG